MVQSRSLTEPEKKIVAARQKWRCSTCKGVLPATYQIDHTVPLVDGGADDISNCTALCPNCHALKTMNEGIERRRKARDTAHVYETRVDYVVSPGTVRCELCRRSRPIDAPHVICPAVELPSGTATALKASLAKFAYLPTARIW